MKKWYCGGCYAQAKSCALCLAKKKIWELEKELKKLEEELTKNETT